MSRIPAETQAPQHNRSISFLASSHSFLFALLDATGFTFWDTIAIFLNVAATFFLLTLCRVFSPWQRAFPTIDNKEIAEF